MSLVEAWNELRVPVDRDDTAAIDTMKAIYEVVSQITRLYSDSEELASLTVMTLLRRRRAVLEHEKQVVAALRTTVHRVHVDRLRRERRDGIATGTLDEGALQGVWASGEGEVTAAGSLLTSLREVAQGAAGRVTRRGAAEAFKDTIEELIAVFCEGRTSFEEVVREEAGDDSEDELERARARVSTRHYRARRHLLEYLEDLEQAACLERNFERAHALRVLMAVVERLKSNRQPGGAASSGG